MKLRLCNIILIGICSLLLLWTNQKQEDHKKPDCVIRDTAAKQVDVEHTVETAGKDDSGPVPQTAKRQYVRVKLMTQDFASSYHPLISFTCNSDTLVYDGIAGTNAEGSETSTLPDMEHTGETAQRDSGMIPAGDNVTLTPENCAMEIGSCCTWVPEEEKAGFTVTSFERQQGSPTYEGSLTVYRMQEGLVLVNTVDLETYLCSVVPSEMPADYEREALCAQAVCARTYACKKIRDAALATPDEISAAVWTSADVSVADLDDSVESQVYNNIQRTARTDEAVEATQGIIMTCEGTPISAYFFSTSGGNTSTNIWSDSPEEYLACVNTGTLEAEDPWYRWHAIIPYEVLNQRAKAYDIGTLQEMEITKRSDGGAATRLCLYGTTGEYCLEGEYEIRKYLSIQDETITRQDGTVNCDMELLPSAYISFSLRSKDQPDAEAVTLRRLATDVRQSIDETKVCEITGGGYGHGVGLSQNGARHLAQSGRTWQEILHFFYRKIDLTSIL